MFSEMPRNGEVTEIWTHDSDSKPMLLLPANQEHHILRLTACAIPTKKHLLAWARWVAGAEWKRCGTYAHLRSTLQEGESLDIVKVIVRHRHLDFDGNTGNYVAEDCLTCAIDGNGAELKALS